MPEHLSAIDFLISDLRKHEIKIKLPGLDEPKTASLIEIGTDAGNLLNDFLAAYGTALGTLARKIIGADDSHQKYGAIFLIEGDGNPMLVVAFNRLLADFDRQSGQIVYRDPQDFLSDLVAKANQKTSSSNRDDDREVYPSWGGEESVMHMTVRYSLPEPPKESDR